MEKKESLNGESQRYVLSDSIYSWKNFRLLTSEFTFVPKPEIIDLGFKCYLLGLSTGYNSSRIIVVP